MQNTILISLITILALTSIGISYIDFNDNDETLKQVRDFHNTRLKIQYSKTDKVLTRDIQSANENAVYLQQNSYHQDINQIFTIKRHPFIANAYKFQLSQENTEWKKNLVAPYEFVSDQVALQDSYNGDAENSKIYWYIILNDDDSFMLRSIDEYTESPYLCGVTMTHSQQIGSSCTFTPLYY